MVAVKEIFDEIETLPSEHLQEVLDFIGYLKLKRSKHTVDTILLSEKSLAKDWDTAEEDEAWADL